MSLYDAWYMIPYHVKIEMGITLVLFLAFCVGGIVAHILDETK